MFAGTKKGLRGFFGREDVRAEAGAVAFIVTERLASDRLQVQYAYFWLAFSSTLIGGLPAMVGLSEMWNSNWNEGPSEAWNDSCS